MTDGFIHGLRHWRWCNIAHNQQPVQPTEMSKQALDTNNYEEYFNPYPANMENMVSS
jgi:hypothetical protein